MRNWCETRIARAGFTLQVQCRHGGDGRTVWRGGGRPVPCVCWRLAGTLSLRWSYGVECTKGMHAGGHTFFFEMLIFDVPEATSNQRRHRAPHPCRKAKTPPPLHSPFTVSPLAFITSVCCPLPGLKTAIRPL
jgi:hypothetical protein